MASVDYYLSLVSPWTYLGSAKFIALAEQHGATVHVKPMRLAEVFPKTGGLPLGKRSPERQAYRMMELKRWRDRLGVPIKLEPAHFPADETAAQRALVAAVVDNQNGLKFSCELGRAVWERDENITEETVIQAAAERAGVDLNKARSNSGDDAKLDDLISKNTNEAISCGVFGAPSYVFEDGDILWGQDRLDFVDEKLTSLTS